jgi:hypothetical protein
VTYKATISARILGSFGTCANVMVLDRPQPKILLLACSRSLGYFPPDLLAAAEAEHGADHEAEIPLMLIGRHGASSCLGCEVGHI